VMGSSPAAWLEMNERVTDNETAHRFELPVEDGMAVLEYRRKPGALVLLHTEVPPSQRGRGLGKVLVDAAVAAAAQQGRTVVPVCPFAKAYLEKRGQE
jgi:predicted GNAT family acetyltransferase